MHRFRRKLKEFVWVALAAFAGLAVAPTISRAIHGGDPGGAPAGISGHPSMAAMGSAHQHQHHDPATAERPALPAGHPHSLDHCDMCLVAACAFALAMAPPNVASRSAADDESVVAPAVVPRFRDDWSPATSRGPPARA